MIRSADIQRMKEEVLDLSGFKMIVVKYGEHNDSLWLAAAYRQNDEYHLTPVYSNFAPTELQAATDLVEAIRADY